MFSILSETNFISDVEFILLSAKAFDLDQSTILSLGKELTKQNNLDSPKLKAYLTDKFNTCITKLKKFITQRVKKT